jgi:hypothetical protein
MSTEEGSKGIVCNQCGITFTTQQDKEEHMKLEHKEGKRTYWCELVGWRKYK